MLTAAAFGSPFSWIQSTIVRQELNTEKTFIGDRGMSLCGR